MAHPAEWAFDEGSGDVVAAGLPRQDRRYARGDELAVGVAGAALVAGSSQTMSSRMRSRMPSRIVSASGSSSSSGSQSG